MNNRKKRRQIAEDTLRVLEQGFYISPAGKRVDVKQIQNRAERGTKVYSPEESNRLLDKKGELQLPVFQTVTAVTGQTTLDAVRELVGDGFEQVLCLNFASARNPGGGFLGGSQAQEESIARSSGLYRCQLQANEYYEVNRKVKSGIYTDYMIYAPSVPIIKDEQGEYLEDLVSCGIITTPAVNAGIVQSHEPERVVEIEEIMKRRIRKVLMIALTHGHHNIVLGAWGCGVFRNDPRDVARYFKEVIFDEFAGHFQKIVFAIYAKDERFIQPFVNEFR